MLNFLQGAADAGEKCHRLVNPCTKKIAGEYGEQKAEVERVWQREGSRLSAAAAAARFGCQPEPYGKVFPPVEMQDTLADLGLNAERKT